jgi:hypothetical protein
MSAKTVFVYDGNSGEYLEEFAVEDTREILVVLRSGNAAEVWEDGKPLVDYRDAFIKTDSDGFAAPIKECWVCRRK